MDKLPFPFETSFTETITTKYLKDAIFWVGDFHDPSSEHLIGEKTGNVWGVGYGLSCLLQYKQLSKQDNDLPGNFEEKTHNACRYLISKASSGDNYSNWDENVWDTAVICRALLRYLDNNPNATEKINIINLCCTSIKWLHEQIKYRQEKKFNIGIPDISQVLRTFIYAKKSTELKCCSQPRAKTTYLFLEDGIKELVNDLLYSSEPTQEINDGEKEQVITWNDDIFETADAIISLSHFVQLYHDNKLPIPEEKKLIETIKLALRYLEIEQVDGRWGIEESTTVALRAYVIGWKTIGEGQAPEPHIVFKAIRYLCDSKTIFPDGSIAHKMEPTVYLIQAFIDILENWALPDNLMINNNIHELYDYIIWNTPTRSTIERVRRMQIESEKNLLQQKIEEDKKKSDDMVRIIIRLRALLFLFGWFLMGYILACRLGFINASWNVWILKNIEVKDWGVLLTFLTLWGGLWWFIYEKILRWNEFHLHKTQ